jgi:hypothetical protein
VPGAPVPVGGPDVRSGQETTSSTAEPGAAGAGQSPAPADVSGTREDQGTTTRPARVARQLGETGDGTRRLIILGGIAMLLGAVVIGFTGRDEAPAATPAPPAGLAAAAAARRRRNRPRRGELFGWDGGVPLNPGQRELARRRAGLTADYADFSGGSNFDDEL